VWINKLIFVLCSIKTSVASQPRSEAKGGSFEIRCAIVYGGAIIIYKQMYLISYL